MGQGKHAGTHGSSEGPEDSRPRRFCIRKRLTLRFPPQQLYQGRVALVAVFRPDELAMPLAAHIAAPTAVRLPDERLLRCVPVGHSPAPLAPVPAIVRCHVEHLHACVLSPTLPRRAPSM